MLGSGDRKLWKLKDIALVNVNGVSTEKKLVIKNREKRMKKLWKSEMFDREVVNSHD